MVAKRYLNNKGITLVELIVVVALIGVIIVPLGTMFITNYIAYFKDNVKIKATADMRFALNEVLESFRRAEQGSITLDSEQRVAFQVITQSDTQNGTIWYDSTEKSLKIQTASTERVLLRNVSGVIMQNIENGRISVRVTTLTRLPFSDPFIYTQTYDYKKRT